MSKLQMALCACVVGLAISSDVLADASAYNGTARWWTKRINLDYNTWSYTNPKASDTATYIAGSNKTDGVTHAQLTKGPETKFNFPLAKKDYTAWNDRSDGPGPAGSTALNSADGSGFPYAGFAYGTNWMFSMAAIADGTLGGGANASWDSITKVKDPSYMNASDFSNIPDFADVYVPVAMLANSIPNGPLHGPTHVSPNGSVGMSVYIDTAQSHYDLFDVTYTGATGQAVITPSSLGSMVSYYLQTNLTDGPPIGLAISAAQLEDAIEAAFVSGTMMSDINVGIVFSGMPVPTVSMDAFGNLAAISVDNVAADRDAAVPEPATLLAALPLFAICHRRARRGSRT